MYGRIRPLRPWASCTVATPCSPSDAISSASARRIRRTTVGVIRDVSRLKYLGDGKSLVDPRVDLPCVTFEDVLFLTGAQPGHGIDIPLRIVEIVARLGVCPPDRPDHLRPEQDIAQAHNLEQQLDPREVVHAGIEEDVVAHQLIERWPLHARRQPPHPPPG